MCKVVVKDSKRNVEFIIYNHLFSKDTSYRFTIKQLVSELHQYGLELSSEYVEEEVNSFVKSGLVNQNFRCYSVCGR
jgi:hypothetical protein